MLPLLPTPPTPPNEPPIATRVAVFLSILFNIVIVAVLSGLALVVDSNEARIALAAGAAAVSGLMQWGLVVYPWNRAVERAKWDALQDYAGKVEEANARIGEANEYKTTADATAARQVADAAKKLADAVTRADEAERRRLADNSAGIQCRNRLADQGVHIDNDWKIVRLPECTREHK